MGIEVNAQLVALNRSVLAEAVNPAPLVIDEPVKLALLKFEVALTSSPTNVENSKVNIACEKEKDTDAIKHQIVT